MTVGYGLPWPDSALLGLLIGLLALGAARVTPRRLGLVTVYGLVAVAGSALGSFAAGDAGATAGGLISPEASSQLLRILVLVSAAGAAALGLARMRARFFAGIVLGTLGACVLTTASDLVMALLGLELVGVASYGLIGIPTLDSQASSLTAAALRRLLVGFGGTALFLYGASLWFGLTGSTQFAAFAGTAPDSSSAAHPPMLLACLLLLGGLGTKLSLVPFPEGTSAEHEAPVGAFLMTVPLIALGACLLRILPATRAAAEGLWLPIGTFGALAAMVYGNLRALSETKLLRVIGYAAVSQVGMLLLGLMATLQSATAVEASRSVILFLASYSLAMLGAIAVLGRRTRAIADLGGWHVHAPFASLTLASCLMSLAGLPPLVGFWSKLQLFKSAIGYAVSTQQFGFAWLVLVAALSSVWLAYDYLRILRGLFTERVPEEAPVGLSAAALAVAVVASAGALLLFWLPQPLWQAATQAAAGL